MAKTKRLDNLPEWFALEKYRACRSFRAVDWLEQLSRRRDLLNGHPDFFTHLGGYVQSELHGFHLYLWRGRVSLSASIVRAHPVASEGADIPNNLRRLLAKPEAMPVKPVTVTDLVMQSHRDGIAVGEHGCDPRLVRRWEAMSDPYKPYADVAGMTLSLDFYDPSRSNSAVIQVDMEATDAVLVKAFTSWLKQTRAEQRMLEPISDTGSAPDSVSKRERPAYKKWHGYGLLPYLDLLIWTMETGNQISYPTMAQAVGYCKGGNSFGRTVPKLADDLMRSLAELEALAVFEATAEKLRG